jgi:hypothetical protein
MTIKPKKATALKELRAEVERDEARPLIAALRFHFARFREGEKTPRSLLTLKLS